jgi:hypothetical protein
MGLRGTEEGKRYENKGVRNLERNEDEEKDNYIYATKRKTHTVSYLTRQRDKQECQAP